MSASDSDDTSSEAEGDTNNGEYIEGSEGNDTIDGTGGHDLLSGLGSDDQLTGKQGNDVIFGGNGEDSLKGSHGHDWLDGGNDDDMLQGNQGEDHLIGGAGNDTLSGGDGDDLLVGADTASREFTPEDYLAVNNGASFASLGITPQVPTEEEVNVLDGGGGDDWLFIGENDTATGGAGDDVFELGSWIDEDGEAPLITDFDEEDDVLMLNYLDSGPAPTITLETDGDERLVRADGLVVARVQGDGGPFFPEDVQLVPVGPDGITYVGPNPMG